MPAYRSSAEAEIREAVVARLRELRPAARIIHEINASGQGSNRMDMIAVDRAEIIAVEIKSAKDKLDRLRDQLAAMRKCSHLTIAAIHDKFLVEQKTHPRAQHYERDGEFYLKTYPNNWDYSGETWVFPRIRRALDPTWYHDGLERWDLRQRRLDAPLPEGALDLLWREELKILCSALRVSTSRKSTMPEMVAALRWHSTGKELTQGICWLLRARECCEADAAIIEKIELAA